MEFMYEVLYEVFHDVIQFTPYTSIYVKGHENIDTSRILYYI